MHVIKNCHQNSYGFQNLMSSWGWGSKFSNLPQVGDFSFFGSKSVIFFFFLFFLWIFKIWCQAGPGSKFSNLQQVGDFSIFGSFFWGVEGHKIWVLLGGFNCADWTVHLRDWATTMSLRGPATQHLHNERAKRASLMGRDGRTVNKSVL